MQQISNILLRRAPSNKKKEIMQYPQQFPANIVHKLKENWKFIHTIKQNKTLYRIDQAIYFHLAFNAISSRYKQKWKTLHDE